MIGFIFGIVFYIIMQLAIGVSTITGSSIRDFFEERYVKDDNGLIYLRKRKWYKKILIPVHSVMYALFEKDYIKLFAQKNAESNSYNNIFAKEKAKAVYDKHYKDKRKSIVIRKAIIDSANNYLDNIFENPVENALYQEAYLRNITDDETTKDIVMARLAGLYDEEDQPKPVSEEDFKKIVKKNV